MTNTSFPPGGPADPLAFGPTRKRPALEVAGTGRQSGRAAGGRLRGGGADAGAIAGSAGALSFELSPAAPAGVHVMRVHQRPDGSRVHCSVLFDDAETFSRWLEADPLRFTHPHVFQQALRRFAQLMGADAAKGA